MFDVRAICFLSYSCTVLSISGKEFDYFAAFVSITNKVARQSKEGAMQD